MEARRMAHQQVSMQAINAGHILSCLVTALIIINTLTWTVSVSPCMRPSVTDVTHRDAVSFPQFELHTGYVNGTRAPRIFRIVQFALSASDTLTGGREGGWNGTSTPLPM